jgi:hypothetical protein
MRFFLAFLYHFLALFKSPIFPGSEMKNHFFYNRQKNVTFMHRYQVAKYVIFDSEKIFVKKFPWMLK